MLLLWGFKLYCLRLSSKAGCLLVNGWAIRGVNKESKYIKKYRDYWTIRDCRARRV